MSTLSVVIPTYNASGYLGQVLQAIVDQSFRPLEVIVIDDGSSDNSVEVIEEVRRRVLMVKLLRNECNMGGPFTAIRGLKAAVGDYVYFASTSDRVLPGLFEKAMRLLAAHPDAALFCSDFIAFYSQGPQLVYSMGWEKVPCFLSPQEFARAIKQKGGYVPGATTVVRRSALLEAGGFIAELRGHTDWFACLVAGFRHGICYIPEPLAAFRMAEPGSISSAHRQWKFQREILKDLFVLLGSKTYQDVAPFFRSSAAMACLPYILRAVLGNSERWGYLSSGLIRHALRDEFRRIAVRLTPMLVKDGLLKLRRLGRTEQPLVEIGD